VVARVRCRCKYTKTLSSSMFKSFCGQDKEKKWSWFAGPEKPGIFEIDWQKFGKVNRIALALECRQVGIVDLTKVPSLRAYS